MFPKCFLFCFLVSLSLFASHLSLDGRVEVQNTFRDLTTFTALYNPDPVLGVHFKIGARLSNSTRDLEVFSYALTASLPLFSFFETSVRLSNENLLNSTTAQTHWLFLAKLNLTPFSFWKFFIHGGWYKRNVRLNKPYLLPSIVGSSFSEHDFAVDFGTEILWNESISSLIKVSTFEEISVYNLNNPFIQGQVSYSAYPTSWKWTLYSRYRLLLGFGRMDSFTAGINLEL